MPAPGGIRTHEKTARRRFSFRGQRTRFKRQRGLASPGC